MAKSKALTKETRAIVNQKASAATKRVKEAYATRSIASEIGSGIGVAAAATCDAMDWGIPVGESGSKISISLVGTAVGIGAGLALGKGAAGGAAMGFGIGQFHGFLYDLVRTTVPKVTG